MIELLAPSGDEKSFITAINAGADAIYIGMGDFSARKNAQNFNAENIAYYVSYAHALGVKVYVAINTLIKDDFHMANKYLEKVLNHIRVGIDGNHNDIPL